MNTSGIDKALRGMELDLLNREIKYMSERVGSIVDRYMNLDAKEVPKGVAARILILASNWAELKEQRTKLLKNA